MDESRIKIRCAKKYVKIGQKYNVEVYILTYGDEWGHLYTCSKCGKIVYSFMSLDAVNENACISCGVEEKPHYYEYPRYVYHDGKIAEVDADQLKATVDEYTEIIEVDKMQ